MSDVAVTALCDIYPDRVDALAGPVAEASRIKPRAFTDYRAMIDARSAYDALIIPTSMITHGIIALDALRAGIYTAIEVGGAASLEECWALVRASEEHGAPLMMLENCCYGRRELLVTNLARQGQFGRLMHCRGGYAHNLSELLVEEHDNNRHMRIYNYMGRNGDIYPTHGLGPYAKLLDINKGNRMVSLVSMASKSRGLPLWISENKGPGHPFAKTDFTQGDVITTAIRCANGELILLTHDTQLPRPYSRAGLVQGTKGIWIESDIGKDDEPPLHFRRMGMLHIEGKSPMAHDRPNLRELWEPASNYLAEYEHPLWREYLEAQGNGVNAISAGMDTIMLRAMIDGIREGRAPIDVYDAAAWMSITCLSEESIQAGSASVAIPDFTSGKWIERKKEAGKYSLD